MCGRFTLRSPAEVLVRAFGIKIPEEYVPRHNIAPGQPVLAVRIVPEAAQREAVLFHWGLIPSWAKDPKIAYSMINARAESVAEKPSFRKPIGVRRCLIPADGWYEWKKSGTRKMPFYFRLKDGAPFAFAGLWEHWQGKEGEEVESCTIITTQANDATAPIHDRMPAIIGPKDFDLWLDPSVRKTEKVLPILAPYPSAEIAVHPVSTLVNNSRVDKPQCIEPVEN